MNVAAVDVESWMWMGSEREARRTVFYIGRAQAAASPSSERHGGSCSPARSKQTCLPVLAQPCCTCTALPTFTRSTKPASMLVTPHISIHHAASRNSTPAAMRPLASAHCTANREPGAFRGESLGPPGVGGHDEWQGFHCLGCLVNRAGMRPVMQSTRPGGAPVNGLFERHSKLSRSNVPASPQLGLGQPIRHAVLAGAHRNAMLAWEHLLVVEMRARTDWGDVAKDTVKISVRRSVLPETVRMVTLSRRRFPNALADPGFLLGPTTPQSDRALLAQGCGCLVARCTPLASKNIVPSGPAESLLDALATVRLCSVLRY